MREIHTEQGIYRCIIPVYLKEVAKFLTVKNKAPINAFHNKKNQIPI